MKNEASQKQNKYSIVLSLIYIQFLFRHDKHEQLSPEKKLISLVSSFATQQKKILKLCFTYIYVTMTDFRIYTLNLTAYTQKTQESKMLFKSIRK